jgi:hypothetical protein
MDNWAAILSGPLIAAPTMICIFYWRVLLSWCSRTMSFGHCIPVPATERQGQLSLARPHCSPGYFHWIRLGQRRQGTVWQLPRPWKKTLDLVAPHLITLSAETIGWDTKLMFSPRYKHTGTNLYQCTGTRCLGKRQAWVFSTSTFFGLLMACQTTCF